MTANLTALRISRAAKAALLDTGPKLPRASGHAAKREKAIAWLGKRWVLHASNRVAKFKEPLPENFVWVPRVLKGKK